MIKGDIYACIECGFETPKWMGKCTQCGSWDSFKRIKAAEKKYTKQSKIREASIKKIRLTRSKIYPRISTKYCEFNRVLGGGIVKGEVILIGGKPGIGKTTLLLQLLKNINSKRRRCVYVSAEESLEQISIHATRVGLKSDLDVICENDIDSVISALSDQDVSLVVIDSVQTVKTEDLKGLPGGVGQVKECTSRIADFAKKSDVSVILVSHITKGGDLAGPKVLEHIVDAVLYLEGDSASSVRLIRAVKNRFGSTSEIGVFSFDKNGFRDAKDPSEMFILSKDARIGVCKGIIFEGQRAILVEIQALTSKSIFTLPQRVVSGIRKAKVQMLCALLSKYTKVNLNNKDVYINIAKGLTVEDSSLDLCLCIALLSSYFNKKVNAQRVAIGELSLTGQIHATNMILNKLDALHRLGYRDVVIPKEVKGSDRGIKKVVLVDSISSLVGIL